MIPARKDVFGGTLEFCGQVMRRQRALEKFGLSATGLIIVQQSEKSWKVDTQGLTNSSSDVLQHDTSSFRIRFFGPLFTAF